MSPLKLVNNKTLKCLKVTSTFEEPRNRDIEGEKTGDFPENERKGTANFGETPLKNTDKDSDVILTTFAGKKAKLFFYTPRELLLLKDGTFCYKKKNKSDKIKLSINPDNILKL